MRFFVYNHRDFDEAKYFREYSEKFGMTYGYTDQSPTLDNLELARGSEAISIITTPITAPMLDVLKEMGVKMVCTRTIGYDHIDLAYAKKIGMIVTHITYDPEGVADYTVMLMLMAIRNIKKIEINCAKNDFTLKGLIGKRISDCTVGIVGAGRIGISVMRDLKGFGCRIIYCNRTRKEEADQYAEYVTMDELLEQADIVSLHLELNTETRHIMNKEKLSRMKSSAILVNTARGPLVDTDALIDALKNETISGAALDVIENEFNMCYMDRSSDDFEHPQLEALREFPNVIHTHHMAFYYETAVRDMISNCLLGMKMFSEGKEIPYRLG